MNNNTDNSSDTHLEIAKLLPWYVNKSLIGPELKALELHLGTCLACNRELMQLEKLAKAVRSNNAFNSAENASLARLKQRINSGQNKVKVARIHAFLPKELQSPREISAASKYKRFTMNSSPWAIAATLLLALLAPLNFVGTGSSTPLKQYKTLSDGQSEKLKSNEIRVVFAENLAESSKSQIISAINGQFIGKASLQGAYTVSLPDDMTQASILVTIGQLRKDNRVIFAEPAYALLSAIPPGESK